MSNNIQDFIDIHSTIIYNTSLPSNNIEIDDTTDIFVLLLNISNISIHYTMSMYKKIQYQSNSCRAKWAD